MCDQFSESGQPCGFVPCERCAKAEADAAHWKANHDEMVVRNALLRDRPDLPVERIAAHKEMIRLQEENAVLRAELESCKFSEDDRPDEYTPLIEAAHPLKTKRHDLYAKAMGMVGNRVSKYALVDLVNWLLVELSKREGVVEKTGHEVQRLREQSYYASPQFLLKGFDRP